MTRFMMHWSLWLALALLLLIGPIASAHAQGGPCAPREAMLEQLESSFGETPAGQGMIANGQMIGELTINPKDGNWTVMVTRPDGLSCIALGGDGWEFILSEEKPKGDPS